MNLCRCEKGHFYDKEKYETCPHCAGGSAADGTITEGLVMEPGVTVPVQNNNTVSDIYAKNSVTEEYNQLGQNNMPIAGYNATDVTVPLESTEKQYNTIPISPISRMDTVTQKLDPFDSDDGCTIGIFDEEFFKPDKSHMPTTAPMTVNKVSTPCVGWLVALSGEHIGTDFRLKVGKNFIGRNRKNDIALTEDKSVSRDRHAIVVYEPKMHMYLVQPGEASTLVYLNNDVVLTPVKLQAYDMITVGEVNLLFMPLCGDRFNWGDLFAQMKRKN